MYNSLWTCEEFFWVKDQLIGEVLDKFVIIVDSDSEYSDTENAGNISDSNSDSDNSLMKGALSSEDYNHQHTPW